ncbi:GDSL-type esterase/lipase family protein [Neobacillus drentensis]|uniref:GDSL-type esterase/lipase family protein n=1 Tax=Neobacillus drentensis TaxID=220684 RepID=UPI000826DFB4|nr:GDSL-type esterase/lipase family protein [Neobacillus drentensis]
MRISNKFKCLVLAGALLMSLPVNAFAKGPEKNEKSHEKVELDYVALGDSLAVGYTPFGPGKVGYPFYISQYFGKSGFKVDYDNYAVPGYTSVQLANDVLTNKLVRKGIQEAEYITIDIGGNDLLAALKVDPTGLTAPAAIASASGNIQTILKTIDKLNHHAKVYVMGYYNTFPYLPEQQQAGLIPLLVALNGQISTLSKANGDTYVPTFDVIASNYPAYLPNPTNIHLSLAGYEIVADQFWNEIDNSLPNRDCDDHHHKGKNDHHHHR